MSRGPDADNPIPTRWWWLRHILLAMAGLFFLAFGIQLLVAAYSLNDPFHFVMTFFASNLIILISAALLVGFVCRMAAARKEMSKSPKDHCDPR